MMINENLIGFYENNEFMPKNFDEFNSTIKLRQMFLNLSNNILKDTCNFSKYEQYRLSKYQLKKAFTYKINSLMPFSFIKIHKIKYSKIFKLCVHSTKIINNYLHSEKKNSIFIANKNLIPLAKLISTCFINNKSQLLIAPADSFGHLARSIRTV